MNLLCKFIVMGILVAISIAVLEGAPTKLTVSKRSIKLDTCACKSCAAIVTANKITTLTYTTPKPSTTAGISENSTTEAVTSGSLQKSKSCHSHKPCLKKSCLTPNLKPSDSDDKSCSCPNIFGHFYAYFSWMAQFYKWVEKYGKWMAHGVNRMFC